MQSPPNERELIQHAQKGDKEAVGILYEHYAQAIFQYISYRVASKAIAEDITAEVFLRMIRKLPTYKYTGSPFGAWLYRVASNLLTDHYRKNQKVSTTSIPETYQSDSIDPFDKLAIQEDQLMVRRALLSLSDEYQNVIVLRFIRELPHVEVAEIMNKSEGAVRVLQHRALKALSKALNDNPERSQDIGGHHHES